MTECMQYCQKMQRSRAPVIRNPGEMRAFLQRFAEIVYVPGTSGPFPTALGSIVWSPFTDEDDQTNEGAVDDKGEDAIDAFTWDRTLCSDKVARSNPGRKHTLRSGNFRASRS